MVKHSYSGTRTVHLWNDFPGASNNHIEILVPVKVSIIVKKKSLHNHFIATPCSQKKNMRLHMIPFVIFEIFIYINFVFCIYIIGNNLTQNFYSKQILKDKIL